MESDGKRAQKYFKVQINPLQLIDADEPWISLINNVDIDAQKVLDFMCIPGIDSKLESIVQRYKDISSSEKQRLNFAPAEDKFLKKLVWP